MLKTQAKRTEPIKPAVLVIEDDQLFRRSITRILLASGYTVASYESLAELASGSQIPQVGCAILDLNLADSNGLDIQERLTKLAPTLSVIFLTGFGQVSSSVRAMKAGAIDFFEKPIEDTILLVAVERAIERSRKCAHDLKDLQGLRHKYQTLSRRERDVFVLIASGLLNKEAGAELGITEKTIKVHRAQVMAKMNASSFAELVRIAQRLGLEREADAADSANKPA